MLHAVHEIENMTRVWVGKEDEDKAAAIIARHHAAHAPIDDGRGLREAVFRGAFPVRAGHCKPDEIVVLVDQFNAVADKLAAVAPFVAPAPGAWELLERIVGVLHGHRYYCITSQVSPELASETLAVLDDVEAHLAAAPSDHKAT